MHSQTQYPHGGDAPAVARSLGISSESLIDLSASLNPFAPDVTELASKRLGSLVAYPDDTEATDHLAAALGVPTERLVLTNGGAEAIALVADLAQAGNIVEPEFSLYRRHLAKVDPSAGRWRSNPGNPLGELAPAEAEAAVWDEAFYPIATGQWTRGDVASWRIGSMTKLWACAGLRLGYAIAPSEQAAKQLLAKRPRWSVNGLALALVPDLLEQTDLTGWNRQIQALGKQFAADLVGLGFDAGATSANWVLLQDADGLRERLIPHHVLVRDCANFGLTGTVRAALPAPDQYDKVLCAFESEQRRRPSSAGN